MTDEIARAQRSCVGWMSQWAVSVEGGDAIERDGLLLAVTGAPQEWWNIAFITRPLTTPEATLRETTDWFDQRRQRFIVRVREDLDPAAERALLALGYERTDTLPGMVLAPIPEAPAPPAGLDIRQIEDAETLEGALRVAAEAYEIDGATTRELLPLALFLRPNWAGFVGYADGEPAATATVATLEGMAAITFVGTRPAFRKRGFGEAITWRAVMAGAAMGCAAAALEASEMGYPIYQRMGFRHVTGYKTFVLPKNRT